MIIPSIAVKAWTRGSSLLEGLLAIVLFSIGMLALLMLLSTSLIESSNAQYRSDASLLASGLIAQMWTGDRTVAGLKSRFADMQSVEYKRWLQSVQTSLPGITSTSNQPSIVISDDRQVTVTLRWQPPSESRSHQLLIYASLTD